MSLQWGERIRHATGKVARSWELLYTSNRPVHVPGAKVPIPKSHTIKVAVVFGVQGWERGPTVFQGGGGPRVVTRWYWDELKEPDASEKASMENPTAGERVMTGHWRGPFKSMDAAKADCWEVYAAAEVEQELKRAGVQDP